MLLTRSLLLSISQLADQPVARCGFAAYLTPVASRMSDRQAALPAGSCCSRPGRIVSRCRAMDANKRAACQTLSSCRHQKHICHA